MTGYTFTTIIDPAGETGSTAAVAINDSGEITGTYKNSKGTFEGFVDNNGTFTTIADPSGAGGTFIGGINDSGEIVGAYNNGTSIKGFIYDNGSFTTITDPSQGTTANDYTEISAITDSGELVGLFSNNGLVQYFVDNNGSFTTIIDPSEAAPGETNITGINASGEITGYYDTSNSTVGFIDNHGTFTTLIDPSQGSSPDSSTQPYAIDASGDVIGQFYNGTLYQSFLYNNGSFNTFNEPSQDGPGDTTVEGISAAGAITGNYLKDNTPDGFIDNHGTFTTLIDPSGGSDGNTQPSAVNDSGEVIGQFYNGSIFQYFAATPLCYLRGTLILTPEGQKPIETLTLGDKIITRFSGVQPIKWIGRQSFAPHFIVQNPEKWPVTITAGALGDGFPARDLSVSPGHSVLLGTSLILASSLVNGITIRQDMPLAQIDYFNIELATHDCVLAAGTWAETYADAPGQRAQFHNEDDFWTLYPDHVPVQALTLCAPRPQSGPDLENALRPIIARTSTGLVLGPLEGYLDRITPGEITGWARDASHPHLPVLLDIMVGVQSIGTCLACNPRGDLEAAGLGNCAFAITLPNPLTEAEMAALAVQRHGDAGPATTLPKAA